MIDSRTIWAAMLDKAEADGVDVRTYHLSEIEAAEGSDADAPRSSFLTTVKSQAFDRDNHSFRIKGIKTPNGGIPIMKRHNRDADPIGWVDTFTRTEG